MKLPTFEYAEPDSIQECCRILSKQGDKAKIIAGGTDLLMALKNRLKSPSILVDISRIPELNQIHYSETEGLKVGAMVTLRHFAHHAVVRQKYPIMAQAALAVGDPQLQAMGTVGGNLCQDTCCLYYNRQPMWRQSLETCHKLGGTVCHAVKGSKICWATYCGDLAPAFLVLNASLKISGSRKEKIIPLKKLFSGDGKKPNALSPGQLVKEILVPPLQPRTGGTYLKMRVRQAIDYPLLGVAACITLNQSDNRYEKISIALTGIEKSPIFIEKKKPSKKASTIPDVIENLADDAYQKAHPINNTYGYSPKYRREMVKVYVKSAVQQSIENAKN